MVNLTKPTAGEQIQDPAAGTAGFLIMADRYIKERTDNLFTLSAKEQEFQKRKAFCGIELVQDTQKLALMNAMLHDIEGGLLYGDALSSVGQNLPKADLILTNPPFGTKKGGDKPTRDDFTFSTSNKQLAFLQHIYKGLKPGVGRAAVVLPDNVLFEDNIGRAIRTDLMAKCNLHTILRLPIGIFYAQSVKTNVLFFSRGEKDTGNTRQVWIYDMRTNMPVYGKRTPFSSTAFTDFEQCFGEDQYGMTERRDLGQNGRFRSFSREEILKNNDNLDIFWLHDENVTRIEEISDPVSISRKVLKDLKSAVENLNEFLTSLENGTSLTLPSRDFDTVTLGQISESIQRGKSPKYCDFSELPVINQRAIRWHTLDEKHLKYVHPEQIDDWDKSRYIQEGDILWNSTGTGTVGRAYLVKESDTLVPKVVDTHVTILRLQKSVDPEFIYFWIASPVVQNRINQMCDGTTNQIELSRKSISSMSLDLPPLPQQQNIVRKLNELRKWSVESFRLLKQGATELSSLEAAFLMKAFEGKLFSESKIEPLAYVSQCSEL